MPAVALADEEMMPHGHTGAFLGGIRSEDLLRGLHRARVARVEDVIEGAEHLAQRLAGHGGLAVPFLRQRDQVVRDPFDGLAGLVVQVEVIALLDDVALGLAVADENEEGRTVHGPSKPCGRDRGGHYSGAGAIAGLATESPNACTGGQIPDLLTRLIVAYLFFCALSRRAARDVDVMSTPVPDG